MSTYRCPVCDEEVDYIAKDVDGNIVGCEECLNWVEIETAVSSKEEQAEEYFADLQYKSYAEGKVY